MNSRASQSHSLETIRFEGTLWDHTPHSGQQHGREPLGPDCVAAKFPGGLRSRQTRPGQREASRQGFPLAEIIPRDPCTFFATTLLPRCYLVAHYMGGRSRALPPPPSATNKMIAYWLQLEETTYNKNDSLSYFAVAKATMLTNQTNSKLCSRRTLLGRWSLFSGLIQCPRRCSASCRAQQFVSLRLA